MVLALAQSGAVPHGASVRYPGCQSEGHTYNSSNHGNPRFPSFLGVITSYNPYIGCLKASFFTGFFGVQLYPRMNLKLWENLSHRLTSSILFILLFTYLFLYPLHLLFFNMNHSGDCSICYSSISTIQVTVPFAILQYQPFRWVFHLPVFQVSQMTAPLHVFCIAGPFFGRFLLATSNGPHVYDWLAD